jgi:type 1 fimbriae regulatory protein FimB
MKSKPKKESKSNSKRPKRTREHLTQSELDLLLSASKDPVNTRNPVRDYAILLLTFRHGLRVSELCKLKLSDINVETKELYVNRLKDGMSGSHPLHNGEATAVKAWLIERARMNPPADVETVFISERKKPLARTAVFEMVKKLADRAGLSKLAVHPHMLRHSAGFSLINRGTGIRVIKDYLGHESITSTTRYTQLDGKRFAKLF